MSNIFVVNLKAIGLKFGSGVVFGLVVPDGMRFSAFLHSAL